MVVFVVVVTVDIVIDDAGSKLAFLHYYDNFLVMGIKDGWQ